MEYTVMLTVLMIKLVCASVFLVSIQNTLAHLDVRDCKFIPLLPYIQPSKEIETTFQKSRSHFTIPGTTVVL